MTREYFVNRTSYNPATKRTTYRSRCFNTESEAAHKVVEAIVRILTEDDKPEPWGAEALKDLADGIRETDPWAASAAEEAIITLRIISGPDELPIIQEDLASIEGRLRE